MTTLRPEHDAGHGGSYDDGTYDSPGAFEAAVEGLADPLNDPLPGRQPGGAPWPGQDGAAPDTHSPSHQEQPSGRHAARPGTTGRHAAPQPSVPPSPSPEWPAADHPGAGARQGWPDGGQQYPVPQPQPDQTLISGAVPEAAFPAPSPVPAPVGAPNGPSGGPGGTGPQPVGATSDSLTVESLTVDANEPAGVVPAPRRDGEETEQSPTGGRAERRKAAKGGQAAARGGHGRGRSGGPASGAGRRPQSPEETSRPLSRVEARRAARAAKDGLGVIVSRAVGELFITMGVLMLLFVTYQLWWTNVAADQYAGKQTHKIQENWAKEPKGAPEPGAFEPGQGFAIMHIPKLDVVVPIAEGVSKSKVLDHGMVGHYGEGKLKTAMPSDKEGNFAVAGHRNTHGEPFRYINRLKPGDEIVVETKDAYYTYKATRTLPQTPPSNVSVIDPVPAGSGFTEPGRYITLTTCTPEFTSTYRLIVWGKMVEERPRSKGMPDALVS